MGRCLKTMMEGQLLDAARGSVDALYDLGMAFSSGAGGIGVDFVEAHKWFNLAAMKGDRRAQLCRADIAADMSSREIAEAQRKARTWLNDAGTLRAA